MTALVLKRNISTKVRGIEVAVVGKEVVEGVEGAAEEEVGDEKYRYQERCPSCFDTKRIVLGLSSTEKDMRRWIKW